MLLALHQASRTDIDVDPATAAAWNYLETHNPLRPGEMSTHFRFWMARDTYQSVSSTQSLIFVTSVRHYLTTPGLAYTFFACADADFWTPIFAYADATRLTEAEFKVGGHHYGIYAHDWRLTPPTAWLSLLAERETASEGASTEPVHPAPTLVVLSQTEFTTAVHDALKHFARPTALRNNALLHSRLIVESVGVTANTGERVANLQALIKTICDSLQATPREQKFYQAIYHTYLHPAPSQEQAAELMDIPFSTFRRHLKTGVARVTDMLWQREVGSER
ncbi:MAG: sigma-70 family RNA polymerase sigma factor [Abitibacteriaceae bacterium]|nr:sigma-70 family RNA polymerase sigma factor [Abditibacteriaceae bacterium]